MQLTEKELHSLELFREAPDDTLNYFNFKECGLCSPGTIKMRARMKNLAEFRRFILGVETDEEAEKMAKNYSRYCSYEGYLKHFGIEDEN